LINALLEHVQISPKSPPNPILPEEISGEVQITQLNPTEVGRQLSLIEQKLYHMIKSKEFLNQSWTKIDKEIKAPNIANLLQQAERVKLWVISEIVHIKDKANRAVTLEYFINLAHECYILNNFQGANEICEALDSPTIFRLRRTWEEISHEATQKFQNLKILSDDDHRLYRKAIANATPPIIPNIKVCLGDLERVEEGTPDKVSNNLINFYKLSQIAQAILAAQQYQFDTYNLYTVSEIQDFLNSVESSRLEELEQLSAEIEPGDFRFSM